MAQGGEPNLHRLLPVEVKYGAPIELVDLHKYPELDIYPTTVAEYEGLVRATFALLNLVA